MGYGWAPMEWQGYIGTVIVVRKDEKHLDSKHLEVLIGFCRYHMQPLIEAFIEDERDLQKKEVVDKHLTRQAFENYFQQYQTNMVKQYEKEDHPILVEQWQEMASPYSTKVLIS